MFRFFGQSNIHTFPSLALNGPKQVSLWSMASDVDSHAYIKSATMGSCIGGLINSNGLNCPEKFVIAENGDNGNTMSLLDYSDKKSKLGKVFRIFEIEIELRASAKDSDSNGSLPDPFVEIFDAKTNKLIGRTDRRVGAMSASWKDTAFLIRGEQEIIIRVKDAEFLGSRDLGGLVGRFSEISKWESDKWTVKLKSEDLSSDSFPTTPDFR